MDFERSLFDRRGYERQIDRLYRRRLVGRRVFSLKQEGVPLAAVSLHRAHVARRLAAAVRRGRYEFAPGRVFTIFTGGKERDVYTFRLTDLILHGLVAEVVGQAVLPRLSPRLFSYRRGLSWWSAVSLLAAYIRAARRSSGDPRLRGLHVIRRDVDSYTDSIPVHPASPLWPMLKSLLDRSARPVSPATWKVVEQVVRPDFYSKDGGLASLVRGMPTGQPIACVLFNLYLNGLDHELDSIPGGFYARYSDDLLFAHPEARVVQEAARSIDRALAGLGLQVKPDKSLDLYLTGAGRPSGVWPEARGTTRVPFLGTFVFADGTVALEGEKMRELARDLQARARRTARALEGMGQEAVGRAVCAALNKALDPESHLFQHKSAGLLRRAITHRPQLAQLDHLAARAVLGAVTGQKSVRAFRLIPYRKIRQEWGLVSLLQARNKWPKAAV